jgi:hypothetical protein
MRIPAFFCKTKVPAKKVIAKKLDLDRGCGFSFSTGLGEKNTPPTTTTNRAVPQLSRTTPALLVAIHLMDVPRTMTEAAAAVSP